MTKSKREDGGSTFIKTLVIVYETKRHHNTIIGHNKYQSKQVFNSVPPKYKTGMLTTETTGSQIQYVVIKIQVTFLYNCI